MPAESLVGRANRVVWFCVHRYVAFVVVRSRMLVSNRSQRLQTDPLLHGHSHTQLGNYSGNDSDAVDTRGERLPAALGDYGASGNSDTSLGDAKTAHRKSSVVSLSAMGDEGGNFPLIGLSWRLTKVGGPGGGIRTFIARCQFILEYPFSSECRPRAHTCPLLARLTRSLDSSAASLHPHM